MNGLYLTLMALLSLVVSFLWGKATAQKKNEDIKKVSEIQKDVTHTVAEVAEKQAEATKEHEHQVEQIGPGMSVDDMGRIAADMAQRALNLGAKEAK